MLLLLDSGCFLITCPLLFYRLLVLGLNRYSTPDTGLTVFIISRWGKRDTQKLCFPTAIAEARKLAESLNGRCLELSQINGGIGCESVERRKPSGPCPCRNSILCTFSHSAEGVLVGLIGHPAHHVWHAHALLVRGIWSHRVPFWVWWITYIWEWVVHTDCTASERYKRWKLNDTAASSAYTEFKE